MQVALVGPTAQARRAAELALRYRLPTIGLMSGFVEAGGLASYSISSREMARKTASYVERILKGARAGGLQVEQVDAFQVSLNLKTAAALELEFPDSLLARADAILQ